MDSNNPDLREVWRQDVAALTALLQSGHPIEPDALAGKSFRGVSIGLPPLVIHFTWLTFRKRFWRRQGDGELCGHNERLEQTGTDGASVPMVDTNGPIVFGPFVVTASAPNPFGVSTGLLLDYGLRHPAWHPLARVRDPLVSLRRDRADLLLGATYLQFPWGQLRTPSFFTLQRED